MSGADGGSRLRDVAASDQMRSPGEFTTGGQPSIPGGEHYIIACMTVLCFDFCTNVAARLPSLMKIDHTGLAP